MDNIERIEKLMLELEAKDNQIAIHEEMLRKISDSLSVAMWAKDLSNRFVYANRECCDTILRCKESDAIAMTDNDFENDALSPVCGKSDDLVRMERKTMRFIEHARYPDGWDVWLDTTKSPWIDKGEVIGTVGIGTIITHKVSHEIRDEYKDAGSFEIPIDSEIGDILFKTLR